MSPLTLMLIALAMMSIGTQGHPVMHTQSHPIKNNLTHLPGRYTNISETHDVVYTHNSMCTRKKDYHNQRLNESNGCNYGLSGCSDCVEFCSDHGYKWFCCDGSWCCCYAGGGGPCKQPNVPCTYTYC